MSNVLKQLFLINNYNIINLRVGAVMNIVDFLIIILIILYPIKGFKNGAIKELVTFGGYLLVLVIAFLLKNPVSIFLYEHLPFLNFGGLFAGVSVLNIILYELIAFFAVATILMIFYRLIIMATNVIDMALKATVILEIPSKILGIIVGAIEGLVIVFILLFISVHWQYTKEYIDASKYGNVILKKSPILSDATNSVYSSIQEIHTLANEYKDSKDKEILNLQALNVLLKYKIIEPESAESLVKSGKLKIDGAEELIDSYNTQL